MRVPGRVRSFRSPNGNDIRFWLKHTLWQVVYQATDELHKVNELTLQSVLGTGRFYLLRGQRQEVYFRMLAIVRER